MVRGITICMIFGTAIDKFCCCCCCVSESSFLRNLFNDVVVLVKNYVPVADLSLVVVVKQWKKYVDVWVRVKDFEVVPRKVEMKRVLGNVAQFWRFLKKLFQLLICLICFADRLPFFSNLIYVEQIVVFCVSVSEQRPNCKVVSVSQNRLYFLWELFLVQVLDEELFWLTVEKQPEHIADLILC